MAQSESRLRGVLEIATAVLLGLVSVATAAGAYQASEWAKASAHYASAATQLRDASLSNYISSQVGTFDDGERILEALNLEFDLAAEGADELAIREQQEAILGGGSPGLIDEWVRWVESGYANDSFPATGQQFAADRLASTFGANRASGVAYDLSQQIGGRSLQITIASVVFAVALLLLGVSGANRSLKVSFALALGGAATFLVGVAISLFAVVG